MTKKKIMSFVKKLAAGTLAVGIIVAGMVIAPKQVAAEDAVTIKSTVDYVLYEDAKDYWNKTPKAAPVQDGYVFGGWFKEVTAITERTETYVKGNETKYYDPLTEVTGAAYAKFVPAQVLSVKAQNGVKEGMQPITKAEDISESNPMWVRVMTAQDSKNYQTIGFDIRLANVMAPMDSADDNYILESNKVFSQVYVKNTLTDASEIFGDLAEYVSVWQLDEINYSGNADKIIYVRPYWYTMDGTKVLGLAKYVHIEDEYKDYISVPVNILSPQDIAAGSVNMSYDYTGLEFVGFEEGRVLPEMTYNHQASTFYMVGNAKMDGEYNTGETIYANIRFKKPAVASETVLKFNMTPVEFGNWKNEIVENVATWDITYTVQALDPTDPVALDIY